MRLALWVSCLRAVAHAAVAIAETESIGVRESTAGRSPAQASTGDAAPDRAAGAAVAELQLLAHRR